MKLKDIPDEVVTACKERGLTEEEIQQKTPIELFKEYCNWEGFFGYDKDIWRIVISLAKNKS